jgi:hypothetical protein
MKFRRSLVPFARLVTFLSSGVVALSITIAPTASAAALLDQEASFKGDGSWSGVTSSQSMAQIITAGISGTLTKVALGIAKSGTVTNLTIGIYPAASGVPTGSALASTTITDFSGMSTGQVMFDIDFATPAAVTAGTTYAIVATTTNNSPAYFKWYYTSAYIGGDRAENVGSGWYPGATRAFTFATYVLTSSSSSSSVPATGPADVTQQFGRPIADTCNAAAPESLNWSGVSSGGWGESWAQWMNGGSGGPVCTRTLVYSTAQSKWIVG